MVKRISVFITTIPQMFLCSFSMFSCILYTSKQLREQYTSQISAQAVPCSAVRSINATKWQTNIQNRIGRIKFY